MLGVLSCVATSRKLVMCVGISFEIPDDCRLQPIYVVESV